MSTSWVAGVVRARALAQRRAGPGTARALAGCPDLPQAAALLATTSYRHDVRPDMDLAGVQHAVSASVLWNVRVLAGWLPRSGAGALRVLAAGFETANLEQHLTRLQGGIAEPAFALGTLGTAWSHLAGTTSLAEVRVVLGTSAWHLHDPATRRQVGLGVRLAWAEALVARVPAAAAWARAAAALSVLREPVLGGGALTPQLVRLVRSLLGPAFVDAVLTGGREVSVLRRHLPADCRWSLEGVEDVTDLWRAEAAWWRRVEHDGFRMLGASSFDERPVVGAVAVLGVDAWRVRAALEVAARGGAPGSLEAFDGVA